MNQNIPADNIRKQSLKKVSMANSSVIQKISKISLNKIKSVKHKGEQDSGYAKVTSRLDQVSPAFVKDSDSNVVSVDIDANKQVHWQPGSVDDLEKKTVVEDGDDGEDKMTRRRKLEKLKSSVSAVFEFGDDEDNDKKIKSMNNDYFFLEYETNYDMKVYFEFLIYHLLYYSIFGPVMAIFLLIFPKTRILMGNLLFIKLSVSMILQIFFWINFGGIVLIMFMLDNPVTAWPTLISAILSIMQRSSNICAKYATFPKKLIQKYREQSLTVKEIEGDFMMGLWRQQGSELIDTEINNAMQRNIFDVTLFKMSFLAKVNDKFEVTVKSFIDDVICSKPWKNEIIMQCGKVRTYYCGQAIFGGIVKIFNETKNRDLYARIPLIMIIGGFTPLWPRLVLGLSLHNPTSTLDTIVFYSNCFTNMLLVFFISLFFTQARRDIRRVIFAMHQLSHLVSIQRHSKDIVKLLPTVNFLEELSLNSWKIMRRVAVDYGKKYFYRHELFMPVIFLLALGTLVLTLILEFTRVIYPNLLAINVLELEISMGVYSFVLLAMTFDLLWAFSTINEFFELHTLKLHNVKAVLYDLRKYKPLYFSKYLPDYFKDEDSQRLLRSLNGVGQSHVHGKLALEISQLLGDRLENELVSYLDKAILSIDIIIEEITIDQKYQSIEILGFVITKNFTGNLAVLLISVIFGFLQIVLPSSAASS